MPMLYLKHQIVNLDLVAEISVKREWATLRFAFARLDERGARLFLSPAEAHPLLTYLNTARESMIAWVATGDRMINLDLVADVWVERDQIRLVPVLPDQRGGPLPRSFSRRLGRPILAYFQQPGVLVAEEAAQRSSVGPSWAAIGDHLINLALVTSIRFAGQQVLVSFTGLPNFSRSFPIDEAGPLLDYMQHLGVLPIEAVQHSDGNVE